MKHLNPNPNLIDKIKSVNIASCEKAKVNINISQEL